ncbi:MAG: imidazole glycerol phosphate synthase subunit HisF [Gammaproteobacteria bacterium CG22_combo_CG10-13_8_21_14_all_40_8]|nr:MAG: imidazole glycerol phosphate synthase subunit HisF [Gammaproteobacteria bacterium CG22_combo_CG10-13_8_21_14_all_40_8]
MNNFKNPINNLAPRIIVCMDIKQGRVVKGVNFKQLKDMGEPIELALLYEQQGVDELVFLDIAATIEKQKTALNLVAQIAQNLSIPFTVGGGLTTLDDVKAFLDAGADKVALNTTAILTPSTINETAKIYGNQCIVVAVDVLKTVEALQVYSHGGQKLTNKKLLPWCQEVADRGVGEILLTCMHKDGVGDGFDCALTQQVSESVPVQVIASGGASHPVHFYEAFNQDIDACLAAGMFHSKKYTVNEVKDYLFIQGIPVRKI